MSIFSFFLLCPFCPILSVLSNFITFVISPDFNIKLQFNFSDNGHYNCVWFRQRTSNVLELQFGRRPSTVPSFELCDYHNFWSKTWTTLARTDGEYFPACPVAGEYTGKLTDNPELCAKLYSNCNKLDMMYFLVTPCHNSSQIIEGINIFNFFLFFSCFFYVCNFCPFFFNFYLFIFLGFLHFYFYNFCFSSFFPISAIFFFFIFWIFALFYFIFCNFRQKFL